MFSSQPIAPLLQRALLTLAALLLSLPDAFAARGFVFPATTHYHWDAQDRLTGVDMPEGKNYSYQYDYRTRRIGIGEAEDAQPVKHTAVVFSGGLSVAEYEETGATQSTISAPQSPTVEYVRGLDMGGGVGGLLYSVRQGSLLRYDISNGRGDVVAQSDPSAQLTWTASYEAFGKRVKETGQNQDKQRANSKDEDPTGLLNEGFRYRCLETGVWLSRDPAGFVDGPNVYTYVQQNPWTKFDAKGLFWSAIVTVGFAAFDTFQYATGKMSGAEYARSMAVNAASLAADVVSGGMGGGMAVRAAMLGCKARTAIVGVSKAIEKADNIVATAEAVAGAASAVAEGNYGEAMLQVASAAMTGKASATKMDAPKFCFGAGTQVHTARGLEEIQDLEPGRRVLADSGADMAASQVRGEGWLRVEFGFADPFGSGKDCRVVLLRPAAEVARNGWAAGVQVPADFGEEIHTGEQATARVLSVRAAGPVEQGAGHVVTGTFQTWNADVRELWMEGLEAPVRVTGGHRFYSESRGWVEAHRLLMGETVRTRDGSGARVLGLDRLPGVHAVFNLEIEGLHQYHVSPLGLLAHNTDCTPTGSAKAAGEVKKQLPGVF